MTEAVLEKLYSPVKRTNNGMAFYDWVAVDDSRRKVDHVPRFTCASHFYTSGLCFSASSIFRLLS